jgi:hypothetical protein
MPDLSRWTTLGRMDTSTGRCRFALKVLVVAAISMQALAACDLEWVEGICMDDEVSVLYTETGGGYCRARKEGDPDCPEGEIPQERRPGREIDCVPNDISQER